VIFCLKQKGEAGGTDTVNPLQPHFLVYILDDGVARFGFTHPKQILEIMRALCSGKTTAYEHLCQVFNQQTNNGSDMKSYYDLLKKAVKSIESTFRRRAAGRLVEGRNAVLPILQEQVSEQTEFELITWLVIR
jgi:hypothetical protein